MDSDPATFGAREHSGSGSPILCAEAYRPRPDSVSETWQLPKPAPRRVASSDSGTNRPYSAATGRHRAIESKNRRSVLSARTSRRRGERSLGSMTIRRPPGRSTRRHSLRTAGRSAIRYSTLCPVTTSILFVRNGRFAPSARIHVSPFPSSPRAIAWRRARRSIRHARSTPATVSRGLRRPNSRATLPAPQPRSTTRLGSVEAGS
jgi:hypothetical protein